ncbi:MAG: uroporphyrinogen decarboxylase family protein [Armatimonadota bacterium]
MTRALNREEPDRVPLWELIINEPTLSALHGPVDYLEFCEREDLDGVTIFEVHRMTPRGENLVDEWGNEWGIDDSVGIAYPVKGALEDDPDLDRYEPPNPRQPYRLDQLKAAVKRFKGKRYIVFLTHDTFEFTAYLLGMENLLVAYIENPDLAHRLAEIVIEYKIAVAEWAIEQGADAVISGDDYANNDGPLMSPAHFREFVAPYLRRLVEAVHARGVPCLKHTDGYIWPILDDIVHTGIDAIDPVEPMARMDIGEVKQKYGDRVAVMGNVDCAHLLCEATPQDVVEAVKETIAKASVGGGHVLASSNSIHPGVRPENYRAMVEATREYGKYPLDEAMVRDYEEKNYMSKYIGNAT